MSKSTAIALADNHGVEWRHCAGDWIELFEQFTFRAGYPTFVRVETRWEWVACPKNREDMLCWLGY